MLLLLLPSAALAATGEDTAVAGAGAGPPLVSAEVRPSPEFPQRRESGDFSLVIHAPQVRNWPDFERFEAWLAVEVSAPEDEAPRYGTAAVGGKTEVDREARIVRIDSLHIDDVLFAGAVPDRYREVVLNAAHGDSLEVPLDLFLAYLADEVLSDPPPAGFNPAPPTIAVRSRPTLLLFVNGDQVAAPVPGNGLEMLVNANWPLFRAGHGQGSFYLLARDVWLTSSKLDKSWKAATSLPPDFGKLPDVPEYAAARAHVPLVTVSGPAPDVLYATEPTELIVTDGQPRTEPIDGAGGLEAVVNTESPLFRLDGTWYYLVAGRWFGTTELDRGPWTWIDTLPEAFSHIPADHPRAAVRASVPGTVEAKMAALEAMLPTKVTAAPGDAPPVEVSYAGEPKFEPVAGAQVSRAVNSGYDIIEYQGRYYLLYAGIWYQATVPTGPWAVTAAVPQAIYQIPPSSPAYHVTQVTVVETSPTTVVYSYPPAYSTGVYVVYGVPWYGTGWYYPPYVWGRYYYPYRGSYGYGTWYNPATGGYGSRSVWYGPYGGYSYTQGYNPRTGRYGYVETAWDGDEWASHGETFNPRTGVGSETDRYYNESKDRAEMDRTVRRGDDWVRTERTTDFDDGTSQVQRTSSRGGSSDMTREFSEGTLTGQGTITTGTGDRYSISGEQTRAGGTSTITGAEGSATLTTRRQGGQSVTGIEGSQGGQGASVSGQGPGRTTVGQSGSGDLYAGHNGNVYKKTDDGWQHYQDGWQPVDVPKRPQGSPTATAGSGEYRQRLDAAHGQGDEFQGSRDTSQLNRDFGARQRGSTQFQQRQAGRQGMGGGGRARRR